MSPAHPLRLVVPGPAAVTSLTHAPAHVAAATHIGLKRQGNEDCHGAWSDNDSRAPLDRRLVLVVADGMGGSAAGEIASRLTVDTVLRRFREGQGEDLLDDLRSAVEEANRAVHARSREDANLSGMGTTCTAVAARRGRLFVAHVGDSRAYLLRAGRLRPLTQDHSLIATLISRRELTREQARRDPRRNVLTRCLGVSEAVDVDTLELDWPLRPGDTLVLCSDGLHGVISDSDLAQIASQDDPEGICRELIEIANDAGGPDNITVVAARIRASDVPGPPSRMFAELRGLKGRASQLALALILVATAMFGVLWLVRHWAW